MRGVSGNLLSIENIHKASKYIYFFIKCFFLFKKPLFVIYYYIRRLQPNGNMIELRNGLKVFLSGHPHDVITVFVILVRQDYGKVKQDSIVIDIGANIGVFSLYAAYNGAKKVYAYEPNQQAYDLLLKNISCNNLGQVIVPCKLAVLNTNNETVKIPVESSPYNQVITGDARESCEEVKTTTLDDIMTKNGIDFVDLLKLDCEGAEYKIFLNIENSALSRIRTIRMEYHQGPLNDLILCLEAHGFHITRLERDSATLWVSKPF